MFPTNNESELEAETEGISDFTGDKYILAKNKKRCWEFSQIKN